MTTSVPLPGIQASDVVESDFLVAAQLETDGTVVYLTTTVTSTTHATSTVVVGYASDGEGILLSKDHPVDIGCLAILTGTSGADGSYHVATVPTDTSFTTVEPIPDSTGGSVSFLYLSGASRIGFDSTTQAVSTSTIVQQSVKDLANHELLDNEPVSEGTTYTLTRLGNKVTQEKWVQTVGSNVIKTIDYTYTGNLVTQEVRKVYDRATGLTVIAQVTIVYSYVGNSVTSETITRNV